MDFDAGEEAGDVGDEAGNEGDVELVETVSDAVEGDRLESWIAQENLEPIPGSGVAIEDIGEVGLKGLKHGAIPILRGVKG